MNFWCSQAPEEAEEHVETVDPRVPLAVRLVVGHDALLLNAALRDGRGEAVALVAPPGVGAEQGEQGLCHHVFPEAGRLLAVGGRGALLAGGTHQQPRETVGASGEGSDSEPRAR